METAQNRKLPLSMRGSQHPVVEVATEQTKPQAVLMPRPFVARLRGEGVNGISANLVPNPLQPEQEPLRPKLSKELEKCLITQAATEPEAFGQLYEAYIDVIRGVIYRLTGNKHDAEDLAEEVFLKAYQALQEGQYKEQGFFRAWLTRIARNLTISHQRHDKFIQRSIDKMKSHLPIPEPNQPETEVLKSEESSYLMGLIHELPKNRRKVIEMNFRQGMSHKEIAQALGVTEDNVRVIKHRALESLRKKFEDSV